MSNNKIVKASNTKMVNTNANVLNEITTLAKSIDVINISKDFILKDDKGATLRDETGKPMANVGAVIANMALGYELGLSYMGSLTLGKKLNSNAYYSVLRGRELGIDAVTSINKVYNIPSGHGDTIALAVDIIIAKMLEAGITYKFIRDNEPVAQYWDISGKYMGHKYLLFDDNNKLKDDYFLYVDGITTKEMATKAKQEGKIIILQKDTTNVSTVLLERPDKGVSNLIHYSIQEAIDAKLYRGYSTIRDDKGNRIWVKGKDNWNNHPATHLRHRPLSIGGRIIAADILTGIYSPDELIEIIDNPKVQNEEQLKDYEIETANEIEIISNVK